MGLCQRLNAAAPHVLLPARSTQVVSLPKPHIISNNISIYCCLSQGDCGNRDSGCPSVASGTEQRGKSDRAKKSSEVMEVQDHRTISSEKKSHETHETPELQ